VVLRVLGEKMELREFAIFGAIAFARNGQLPDDLEQRSIVIEMQRRRSDEELLELRDDRCESLDTIARMCARWADDTDVSDTDPDMGGLINRTADNWRPLFAIADVIGSDWPERIREAAAVLAPREVSTYDVVLLGDIRDTYASKKTDRLFSSQIADALHEIEGRPWAEFGKAKKPISKNTLARLLKEFKIVPGTVRIGEDTAKGYHLHQFADVFERYLGAQGVDEPSQRNKLTVTGTSTTFSNVTEKVDVTDEKCEKPRRHDRCYGVTVQNGGNGLEGGDDTGGRVVGQDDDLEIPTIFDRRPQADAAHQKLNGCDHCHCPGAAGDELVEVFAGGAPARLHRECLDAWKSGVVI
jgi:hypothetical protein